MDGYTENNRVDNSTGTQSSHHQFAWTYELSMTVIIRFEVHAW